MGGKSSREHLGIRRNMAIILTALLLLLHISQVFSLKCLQCVGTNKSCRMVAKTCPVYETSCFAVAYTSLQAGTTYTSVYKGCSNPAICNQTSIIDMGNRSIYMTSSCCESNFCNLNRYNTAPVYSNRLRCLACDNPNQPCKSGNTKSIFCDGVNNYCVDVSTVNTTSVGKTTTSYSKGCGSGDGCNTLLAYTTVSFQHHTKYGCCSTKDNCNTPAIEPKIYNNYNGINCWSCDQNKCGPDNQTVIPCKGVQIRCMEAFDRNNQTLFKGCSTVNFCSSTFPYVNTLPSISGIECCAGSLCNSFPRIYPPDATPSHARRTTTDFRLLFFLMSFLYVTMGHVL